MPTWVNQNGTRKQVKKMWVNQDGTVKEVKVGWANQGGTVEKVYSTAVNVVIPSGTDYYNHRANNTSINYNSKLNDFLPAGVQANAATVVNLVIESGTILAGGPAGSSSLYYNQQWASNSSQRAETSVPALYIPGSHRSNDTTIPSLGNADLFPDGLIVNITINGGELLGGSGQRGVGPCGNHGCHNYSGRNSGGSGGPCILVDGVNNCVINYIYNSGTVRAGGGGGAGGGWGAGHGHCCPKHGGHGAGGFSNGSVVNNAGVGGAQGGSHGGNSGSGGGGHGSDGGQNNGWPGGYGGSLIEFRNCSSPSYTVSGSTGSTRHSAVQTSSANASGHSAF